MSDKTSVKDISRTDLEVLSPIGPDELFPLPAPYDKVEEQPGWKELSDEVKSNTACSLDGVAAASIPKPETPEEEQQYVDQFVEGLKKLLPDE